MNSFAMLRCSLFKFRARTASSLPDERCIYSCRSFASSACVNAAYRSWTPEEDQKILSLREEGLRIQDVASQIQDRSFGQVRERICMLRRGPVRSREGDMWDSQEDAILLEKYHAGLRDKQIMQYLPGRTLRAIRGRLLAHVPARRERKPWTPAEKQRLVDLVRIDGLSFRATAEALGRHYHSVVAAFRRFGRLGESLDIVPKHWTPTERQRVVDLRIKSGLSVKAIAEEMGRSRSSVSAVWVKYGRRTLTKEFYESPRKLGAWTPEEDALLVTLREKDLSINAISRQIPGRSLAALQSRLYLMTSPERETKRYRQRATKKEMEAIRRALIPVFNNTVTYDQVASKFESRIQHSVANVFQKMKRENSQRQFPLSADYPNEEGDKDP